MSRSGVKWNFVVERYENGWNVEEMCLPLLVVKTLNSRETSRI